MKYLTVLWMTALMIAAGTSGCTAWNNMSAGIAEKAVSGEGYVGYSKIGIDAATRTPTLTGMLINGNYTSIPGGMEYCEYSESEDAGIWNSEVRSRRKRLVFGSTDPRRVDAVLEALNAPDAENP